MRSPSAVRAEATLESDRWRAPVALWIDPLGTTLFVACEKTGSIAVIDAIERKMLREWAVGDSLVALAATPDGRTLAACDARDSALLLFRRDGRELTSIAKVTLPVRPASLVMDRDGRTAFVTCVWSRQVVRVELDRHAITQTTDLSFAPRAALLLPDGRTLAVADAFGNKLALVDTEDGRILREANIPGHNFRGLAVSASGKELLASHMIQTESAPITRDNVFWGIAMTSNVRVVPISALADASKNPVREAHTHFFGDPNNGAGDPDAIATLSNGTTLVCLAGVGDLAIGRYQPYSFRRLHVGRRPTALAVSPDEKTVFVANSHSDTISVIDIERQVVADTIALGPEPRLTLAEEGEQAFYDARLSLDGWFSCHSCHTDGHMNSHRADTFGDGTYGAPKNVLSLLGTGATDPWAWNGSKGQLEDQVRESLKHSMQPKTPAGERTVAGLVAYMRTLQAPPVAAWQRADADAIARGRTIFEARRCSTCHAAPTYTNPFTYDVGLDDGEGGRSFNPPSLAGVAHSAPYFHDGRAETLEVVFRVHNHRLRTALTDTELNDLVAFLKSL
jgi:YVTN family beta-propeller protein